MDRLDPNLVELPKIDDSQNTGDTFEETSEEEWTYTKKSVEHKEDEETMHVQETQENDIHMNSTMENEIAQDTIENSVIQKSKSIPEDTIKRLVQKAEELVSPENCCKVNNFKMTRVKQWLSIEKPDDSCDASGEDDERESMTSEDFDETTTFRVTQGCNSQNTSFTELNHTETTPKVLMRQKRYSGSRPWSVSCISQLGHQGPTAM